MYRFCGSLRDTRHSQPQSDPQVPVSNSVSLSSRTCGPQLSETTKQLKPGRAILIDVSMPRMVHVITLRHSGVTSQSARASRQAERRSRSMSVSRKWIVCAIAIGMVLVVAGNALAGVAPPPPQQDQKANNNNNWVTAVAIVVGGIVVLWLGGFLPGGICNLIRSRFPRGASGANASLGMLRWARRRKTARNVST